MNVMNYNTISGQRSNVLWQIYIRPPVGLKAKIHYISFRVASPQQVRNINSLTGP